MHQSTETPTLWVPAKGRGFDIDPGQNTSISLPPEARVQIKRPATPEATKMKISKFQEKRHVFEPRTFPTLHVQVCSFDFILVLNVLDGNIEKFPQSSSYFGEIRHASLSRLKHSLTVTSEF